MKISSGNKAKKNSFPFAILSLVITIASVAFLEGHKIYKSERSTRTLDENNEQITLRDSNWIGTMKTSDDGKMIVTGNYNGLMQIWNLNNCEIKTVKAHKDAISAIAIDPGSNIIATSSRDDTLKLWDINGNLITTFSGHLDDIESLAFAPNGKFIATGSHDRTVRLWNVETGNLIATFPTFAPVIQVNFVNNGNKIVAREKNPRILILKIANLN